MSDIYIAVEEEMNVDRLSAQSKDMLRELVNRNAVESGLIYPHDPNNLGWKITRKGEESLR